MAQLRLLRDVDPERDHIRGTLSDDAVTLVAYQDFLCPYCRRMRPIFRKLRESLGDRLIYVYRGFPNDRANPGAELAARAAEAAAAQGRFFEMHDAIFDHELPVRRAELVAIARAIGLDVERFVRDLETAEVAARVAEDVSGGRDNGVTGTPALFIDRVRYEGAWDFHSLLEALERPVAARVKRSARVFASLPTSAGIVLLVAAVVAMICANTPAARWYEGAMSAELGIGPVGHPLHMTTREWIAEGLLSFFFLIVGLEIRRELMIGALANRRAAWLPFIAAAGGVVTPAVAYLLLNPGATAQGWPIPTATDVAFSLALLAVLGDRIPVGLRVFVATLAVADDVLSVATLAIVFPGSFAPAYGFAVAACLVALVALNRARVYATWPYAIVGLALWLSLHAFGVHAALTGVLLAMCVPTRPSPSPASLLAQAATALAVLDHADKEAVRTGRDESRLESEPVWEWAARNLSATTERLLSPTERLLRAVAPWSTYIILPLFALSATGISVAVDLSRPDARHILAGTMVGLVIGKPLGILLASVIAVATGIAVRPDGVSTRQFVGAACLCGVGDTLALLMADRAFGPEAAAVAKLGVLAGSVLAALIGVVVLRAGTPQTRL